MHWIHVAYIPNPKSIIDLILCMSFEWLIPGRDPVVCFMGRLTPNKGGKLLKDDSVVVPALVMHSTFDLLICWGLFFLLSDLLLLFCIESEFGAACGYKFKNMNCHLSRFLKEKDKKKFTYPLHGMYLKVSQYNCHIPLVGGEEVSPQSDHLIFTPGYTQRFLQVKL